MLATTPFNLENLRKDDIDREILRVAIIAELDAINLYEQLAAMTRDDKIKAVFMDVAKEEKTHYGEFQAMLLEIDKQQVQEIEHGKKEVKELTGK